MKNSCIGMGMINVRGTNSVADTLFIIEKFDANGTLYTMYADKPHRQTSHSSEFCENWDISSQLARALSRRTCIDVQTRQKGLPR